MAKGKAVLFMQQSDGRLSATDLMEGMYASPFHAAEALRDSCIEDFPEATWAIGQNERSRILMRNENMRRMGFTDEQMSESFDLDKLV